MVMQDQWSYSVTFMASMLKDSQQPRAPIAAVLLYRIGEQPDDWKAFGYGTPHLVEVIPAPFFNAFKHGVLAEEVLLAIQFDN